MRTVNKWEARQAGVTPHPHMQEVLDTALARASDEVKARFAASRAQVPEPEIVSRSGLAVRGVLLPVVVDGRVVLVSVDTDTAADSGLGALLGHLASSWDLDGVVVGDDGRRGSGQVFAATVGQRGDAARKDVSWVDRRDFGQHVAGLVLGITGAAGLDTDRLLALLPQAEPTGTRHIGVADVDFLEQVTAAFARQDFAHGSGLSRKAAVEQLRAVLPLLDARVDPELRPRLMVATAHLAMMAGWMSFECTQHDGARRLWMIGVDLARRSEHPLGTDLSAYLLYDMALQAVHLGRPGEALHLVRVGDNIAVGRYPVSASTTGSLASIRARAHAADGDAAACARALGQAEEHFTAIDPATAPPWAGHLDDTGLAAYQGAAHYILAQTVCDPRAAERAVLLLGRAVDNFGSAYARPRGLYMPDLAGAHALAGDRNTAVTVGHQAVDAITSLSSLRAYDRLRALDTVLQPLHASPGVADLRTRLTATAA